MALSLGYGIVFATMITLLIIPSLYVISDDARKALRRAASWIGGPVGNGAQKGHV
jgi:hypothetical protein